MGHQGCVGIRGKTQYCTERKHFQMVKELISLIKKFIESLNAIFKTRLETNQLIQKYSWTNIDLSCVWNLSKKWKCHRKTCDSVCLIIWHG